MPLTVEWRETLDEVEIDFLWKSQTRAENILVVDWFVRVNVLGEGVEAVDLHAPVDSDNGVRLVHTPGVVRMWLKKRVPDIWKRLRVSKEVSKGEIARRREEGIQQNERREMEGLQQRADEKQRKAKAGEQHTWKEEAERRADVERWKGEIKDQAVKQVFDGSLNHTVKVADPVTSEAREHGAKVGLSFTARAVPGAPAREKRDANIEAPKPDFEKSKTPTSVWDKDRGDKFMEAGDYKAAYLAYTEGLEKDADNLRVLANRSIACIFLSRVSVGLEDVQTALSILARKRLLTDEEDFIRTTLLMRAAQCALMLGDLRSAGRYAEEADKSAKSSRLMAPAERETISADVARIQQLLEFVPEKKQADKLVKDGLFDIASSLYAKLTERNAVIKANHGLCLMKQNQKEAAIEANEAALKLVINNWCVEAKKPASLGKLLHRCHVLERCPNLEDPTLADVAGKNDWLMRQEGVEESDLPSVPNDWEWVRDAKNATNWIAKKRRLTEKERIELGEKMTMLRDVCETKNIWEIRKMAETVSDIPKLAKTAEQMLVYADDVEKIHGDFEDLRASRRSVPEIGRKKFALGAGFVFNHMVQTTRLRLAEKLVQRLDSLGFESECKRELEVLLNK